MDIDDPKGIPLLIVRWRKGQPPDGADDEGKQAGHGKPGQQGPGQPVGSLGFGIGVQPFPHSSQNL
ncbi:hypothetical protein D3C80_1902700 [compost metagenome]